MTRSVLFFITSIFFDVLSLHVYTGKASRTEKYLGACAAGKWVLHKSYLEECRASHSFVKEEPHEWGAIKPGGVVQPLEAAPRTWRLALTERQKQVTVLVGTGPYCMCVYIQFYAMDDKNSVSFSFLV